MEAPNFWDDADAANQKMKTLKNMKDTVELYSSLETKYDDIETLIEMGYEEADESLIPEVRSELDEFIETLEDLRISTLLTGEFDKNNAIRAYEMIRSRFEGRGFDEELNSIYAIEILYSTTMTCLRQNDDARGNYKAAVSKYRFKDKYYRGYAKKYRIILTLFKLGMFRVVAEMLARQKK